MKEPKRLPLSDNPRNKEPQKIPLTAHHNYDIEMNDDIWIKNENHNQDNTKSIQELESDKID